MCEPGRRDMRAAATTTPRRDRQPGASGSPGVVFFYYYCYYHPKPGKNIVEFVKKREKSTRFLKTRTTPGHVSRYYRLRNYSARLDPPAAVAAAVAAAGLLTRPPAVLGLPRLPVCRRAGEGENGISSDLSYARAKPGKCDETK